MRSVTSSVTGLAAAALTAAVLVPAGPATADPDEVDTSTLTDAVTVGGILEHQRALQRIANENDGNRAAGTPGYRASGLYVRDTLREAGYRTYLQRFRFTTFADNGTSVTQVSPTPGALESVTMTYSGAGNVTGEVVPANTIAVPPGSPGSSNSGCTADDFTPASSSAPQVALIQRGFCDFSTKVANAAAAGYDAALIFNEGQEGRTGLFQGNLGSPAAIPAVSISYADGVALYDSTATDYTSVNVTANTVNEEIPTFNVIANSRRGDQAGEPIVVGAHLDSVAEGPGINDNGSGAATILEIAQQLRETRLDRDLQRRVRFAFWGAEESGLLGSQHYVDSLSEASLSRISANLNFDMLGSPNYVRFVYDGDGSTGGPAGPEGSAAIEQVFTDHFTAEGLASAPTEFNGRSDYGPFIASGVPAGGLFSGAEGIKTAEEAEIFGGTAGEAYDACYHQACDDIDNLSTQALDELGDAAADAVGTLAFSVADLVDSPQRRAAPRRAWAAKGHGPSR